jgi:type IV pilus assembly protein PilB
MVTNEELIEAINKEAETAELKKIAMRAGMKTLHQDSVIKVKEGLTTLAEALSTVPQDMELRG